MAFDFTGLRPVYGSLYAPRILGRARTIGGDSEIGNRAAEREAFSEQGQRARLAELSQQDMANEQIQRERDAFELAKRQKEKEEYAKWEREQILNSVANDKFKDMVSSGKFGLSEILAEQQKAAAQEAIRRGKPQYAQEFIGEAAKFAAASAKTKAAALENENKRLDAIKKAQEIEEKSRSGGTTPILDVSKTEDLFGKYTKDAKDALTDIQTAKSIAATAGENPQANEQLNTAIAGIFQGGRLSKEDISLIRTAGSVPERVKTTLNNWLTGTGTQTAIEDKVALLDVLETQAAKKFNSGVDNFSKVIEKSNIPKDLQETYTNRKYELPKEVSYKEVRTLPDGRKIGMKADGTKEFIK